MALPTGFRTIWNNLIPEYSALSDADVEFWVARAAHRVDSLGAWGEAYNDALALMAGHLKALSLRALASGGGTTGSTTSGGTAGTLTSERAGDLAVSYGGSAAESAAASAGESTTADADLYLTLYGVQFLALRGSRAGSGPFWLT